MDSHDDRRSNVVRQLRPEEPTVRDLMDRIESLESQVRSLEDEREAAGQAAQADKLSIVVYSGHLDKLLAAMNIATGAGAMGMEVHLFFTFWATAALRKGAFTGQRPFMDKMFGWMLPAGISQLPLSTMNMGGLGAYMIGRRMREKNVANLAELFEMAAETDVRIHLCEMSMDLLGMKQDDLMEYPHLDQCGVATFLGGAMDSKVTLFI